VLETLPPTTNTLVYLTSISASTPFVTISDTQISNSLTTVDLG